MWLIYWCLRIALFIGKKEYVYKLCGRWGMLVPPHSRRYYAAWEIQKDLLELGYFECPSCRWTTKTRNEHIVPGAACHEKETQASECYEEPEQA